MAFQYAETDESFPYLHNLFMNFEYYGNKPTLMRNHCSLYLAVDQKISYIHSELISSRTRLRTYIQTKN